MPWCLREDSDGKMLASTTEGCGFRSTSSSQNLTSVIPSTIAFDEREGRVRRIPGYFVRHEFLVNVVVDKRLFQTSGWTTTENLLSPHACSGIYAPSFKQRNAQTGTPTHANPHKDFVKVSCSLKYLLIPEVSFKKGEFNLNKKT